MEGLQLDNPPSGTDIERTIAVLKDITSDPDGFGVSEDLCGAIERSAAFFAMFNEHLRKMFPSMFQS